MHIGEQKLRGFFGDSFEKISQFAQLIQSEGETRGLIGPRELPRLWERHILNSAAVVEAMIIETSSNSNNRESQLDRALIGANLVDIGSGAGFPGLVIACMLPNVNVYLLDSMQRRTDWLEYACEELSLTNVEVVRGRAEDVVSSGLVPPCDYVTARAVAALKKLLPWTAPFLREDGVLLALKGENAHQEIIDAKYALRKHNIVDTKVLEVDLSDKLNVNTDQLLTRVVCGKKSVNSL